uniref:CCHC-type domain-containing protein n=1 Tax=Vitis vinifera TaxID=29760 RepID=A5AS33_VITVI|nr:hypothetical protein VITISV_041002 [Vitis vinifera]
MAEEAGKVFGIEKFDGTDFAYWRMQIEDYLYRRKLHLPLLGTKPKCMKADEWAFLDRQVLRVIRLTLSRSVVHNIVKEKTIADLMKALSGMYEKPSANYKVHLMKILFNLNMTENASVAQHLNEFNTITNQLSSVKIDFDDEICALIVLASLPNIWETMRMVVRNSTGKEKLKYNDIQDLILAEEIHQRDAGKTSGSGSALNLETRGRGNDRNSNRGRSKSRNSNRNISKSRSGQQVQCWNCGKTGHFRRQCKSPKKKNENDSANAVTEEVTKGARVLAHGKKIGTLYINSCPRDTIAVADARKQKNVSFLKTGRTPKAKKLELVHTDLYGPFPVASLGGSSKLDAKFKICFFIGYGDEKFGYRFWDEQNRKIIRSRNVIFNEQVMYKDRSTVVSDVTEIDQKKSEFVNLDELTKSTVQKEGEDDKENINSQVDLSIPVAKVCRSSRNIKPPQSYSPVLNYLLLTDGGKPECYDEALQDENSSKWELAMKDEMDSLLGNRTWELTELPIGKKALHNKWVYRIKNEHDRSKRYKTRLVVKGFQQKEGIDYIEIFSLIVKMSTIRLVLGMVAAENLHLEQLDVKTPFLHGDLEEDLYMIQPEGFIFAMKDLGATKQVLGMRIIRDKANGTLKLSQSEYVKKVLNRFNMNETKPVSTPLSSHFKLSKEQSQKTKEENDHMSKVPYASAIGSLMYAMVCTRLDITHVVGVVSRFMSRLGKQHWEVVKWILRYLKGSLDTCLCFTGASLKLQGYVDADFAGDIDSRKSTTGFVFILGGTTISWASNLQKIITLSSTEAEYVAAIEVENEMIWLHGFLDELGKRQEMDILHSDSQSAIFLAKIRLFIQS